MLTSLVSALETFFTNPEFLVPTLWVALGCVIAWYLLSAKLYHSINPQELAMLWKTHKQFNLCDAEEFEPIVKGKKIVGYKCQCGHEHLQERPIVNFGA